LEDLGLGVRRIGTVEEGFDGRRTYLFDLGSDEHACYSDELELGKGDDSCRKKAVDDVDAKEERLRKEAETDVNGDQPVCEDTSHRPGEFFLTVDVIRVRQGDDLKSKLISR
jgi:hypothetical protein